MNPGEILDGRYEIVARLGAGGMGEVYRATHTFLGAPRVIKVVHPNIAGSDDARDRFLREARIATRVQHPNVATLHDFAALPNGAHYMVWEFIEGENLAQRLRSVGILSPRATVDVALQALAGLDAIHKAGIVHRDISPENLMISADGSIKVIDLGVAKMAESESVAQTRTGIFVGKLRYSAPEQLGFIPDGESVDGRADLYALAMVIVELLTGRPPYEAKSPHEYFLRHADELRVTTVELPMELPGSAALRRVLEKALSRDRNARYANAREFASALEEIARSLPPSSEAATVVTPISRFVEPLTEQPTAPYSDREAPTERVTGTAFQNAAPTPAAQTERNAIPPAVPMPIGAVPAPRSRGRIAAVIAALLVIAVAAGASFVVWPKIVEIVEKPEKEPLRAAAINTRPSQSAIDVIPPTETVVEAVAERAAVAPAVVPQQERSEPPAISEAPAQVASEPSDETDVEPQRRRPATYIDGPGRRPGNEAAFDSLARELSGVREVALRAGGSQVEIYRALKRQIPDLQFVDYADVVIRFDPAPRFGAQRRSAMAAAVIEKNGRVIFRYALGAGVDPAAAADAFAETIAPAFD